MKVVPESIQESIDFQRGKDSKEALNIGRNRVRPYPQMTTDEFEEWYNREVFDYNDSDDFDFQDVLSDLVNDETSTDEELREVWREELEVPEKVIKKLLPMRSYFLDFRYIQNL